MISARALKILFIFFSFVLARPSLAIMTNNVGNSSISATMDNLRKVKVSSDDPDIPPTVRPLLKELKHQLRDLIFKTINEPEIFGKTVEEAHLLVLEKLRKNDISVEDETSTSLSLKESYYQYGHILGISLYQPSTHPDLLVATTTIGVCCGEDTSFYLFKKRQTKWELVLTQEVNDYKSIDFAQGLFGYGISGIRGKNVYVVTVNVNPWCTSNWQRIHYRLFQFDVRSMEAKQILSKNDTIYLGVEPPPYKLKVETRSFTLKYFGGDKLNPDGTAPLKTVTYKFKDGIAIKTN